MDRNSPSQARLQLNGVTRADRLACTARVREIVVADCHGWIGDFYQYSNTSLCLHFEFPSIYLAKLRGLLVESGIGFGSDSELAFEAFARAVDRGEVISSVLQIMFIHNEKDLRRHIPAVPG